MHLLSDDGTLEVGLFLYDIPPARRASIQVHLKNKFPLKTLIFK